MSILYKLPNLPLDSWFWTVCEKYVYPLPQPPPRVRERPMEVLCVGMSRSGSESLSEALRILGYPTYHGWDLLLEQPTRLPGWKALMTKKWFGTPNPNITTSDFDALLGHCAAVSDMVAYQFAPELVAAYPDAKVVLNTRKDMAAWKRSMHKAILPVGVNKAFYFLSWFEPYTWWSYHTGIRWWTPLAYRAPLGDLPAAVTKCAPWVYRDHINMIRGMVPPDRLLEWTYEDGWEPLCKFLGKEVPSEPFPHANAAGGAYESRAEEFMQRKGRIAIRNLCIIVAVVVLLLAYVWPLLFRGR